MEDRFGEQINDILSTVQASLSETSAPVVVEDSTVAQVGYAEDDMNYEHDPEIWGQDANDIVFDDHGEGAGIEGDLDVDDD